MRIVGVAKSLPGVKGYISSIVNILGPVIQPRCGWHAAENGTSFVVVARCQAIQLNIITNWTPESGFPAHRAGDTIIYLTRSSAYVA